MPLAAPATRAYPFLLAGIRTVAALATAALAWRLLRAHATAAAGERLLRAVGGRGARSPRFRVRLSARLWLASFGATSLWFLVQNDAAGISDGRWPLLAPWLHTYALPVFAVLAVIVALGWGVVRDWVADVERYAHTTFARAFRVLGSLDAPVSRAGRSRDRAPRRLFGLAFEITPSPLAA